MSDIFISYKREEQATARKLADALESQGWIVWWDPRLRVAEIFDDVIEKGIRRSEMRHRNLVQIVGPIRIRESRSHVRFGT
jgi:hypothetical protein